MDDKIIFKVGITFYPTPAKIVTPQILSQNWPHHKASEFKHNEGSQRNKSWLHKRGF